MKILVVRVGAEPKVEEVKDPFSFAKTSLLKGGFVEHFTLPDGVVVYHDEKEVRHLDFNRAILANAPPLPQEGTIIIDQAPGRAPPGALGEHRLRGNFLLTRHGNGGNIGLSTDDVSRYASMLQLAGIEGRCKRCGKSVAYPGAIFCGAACSARHEAGD